MNRKLLWGWLILLISPPLLAQFTPAEVQFWIGNGPDTSLLVVDFRDGSFDSSYAWGYLHDGSKTGADLLNAVASADPNFSVNMGAFLNDVIYHRHSGIGGQPDFWATWSGESRDSLLLNAGIGTPLLDGEWFALSYTDFNPAQRPGRPIPAFDPAAFTAEDVAFWVGSGPDSAVLVIDFQKPNARYAWGYLFQDSVQADVLLNAVANADDDLQIVMGSFLNDVIFRQDSGIGGSPNFWSTWSGTNLGNWFLNAGIGSQVKNGDFFGLSYTDFSPALRPGVPQAVAPGMALASPRKAETWQAYPNPFSRAVYLSPGADQSGALELLNSAGQVLRRYAKLPVNRRLDLADFPSGLYWLVWQNEYQMLIKP